MYLGPDNTPVYALLDIHMVVMFPRDDEVGSRFVDLKIKTTCFFYVSGIYKWGQICVMRQVVSCSKETNHQLEEVPTCATNLKRYHMLLLIQKNPVNQKSSVGSIWVMNWCPCSPESTVSFSTTDTMSSPADWN